MGDQIGLSHLGHMLAREWGGHSDPNRGHTGRVALSPQKQRWCWAAEAAEIHLSKQSFLMPCAGLSCPGIFVC